MIKHTFIVNSFEFLHILTQNISTDCGLEFHYNRDQQRVSVQLFDSSNQTNKKKSHEYGAYFKVLSTFSILTK